MVRPFGAAQRNFLYEDARSMVRIAGRDRRLFRTCVESTGGSS